MKSRGFKIAVSYGLYLSIGTAIVLACINPPTRSGNGVRPNTTLRYQFTGSNWTQTQKDCVKSGLDSWTNTNVNGGNNVRFEPVQSGQAPNVTLSKVATSGTVAGGITSPSRDSDGYITGFGMQFTTNTNLLSSCSGFKKVAMHEGGHGQNLGDANGSGGSSVMNQLSGKDDTGNALPTSVTDCDREMAQSESPPPPTGGGGECDPMGTNAMNCQADGAIWDAVGCYCNYSPIMIQLTAGASYRLTGVDDGVEFDFDGDGVKERTAWTAPGSDLAFLVLDRNGNNAIDGGAELFGNFTPLPTGGLAPNGFEALVPLDTATPGLLDSADPGFANLRLWRDDNHNGQSEAGELLTLDDAGIESISLSYHAVNRRDGNGNRLTYQGSVLIRWSHATVKRPIYDVFLRIGDK